MSDALRSEFNSRFEFQSWIRDHIVTCALWEFKSKRTFVYSSVLDNVHNVSCSLLQFVSQTVDNKQQTVAFSQFPDMNKHLTL